MVVFSGIILVGLLLVGILVLGASLAAKAETRPAGLWIMGITFALAVLTPLAWLFFGYGMAHQSTAYVRGGDGRMIAVHEPAIAAAPMFALFLIGIVVVGGLIALLVNERTRKAGFMVLGFLGACLLAWIVVGTASLEVKPGAPATPVTQAQPESMRGGATMIVDESYQIPVDRPPTVLAPQPENVTTPSPSDAIAQPAAAGPPAVTPPDPIAPAADATDLTAADSASQTPPKIKMEPNAARPATRSHPPMRADLPSDVAAKIPMTTGDKSSLPEWAKQGGGIAPDGTYFTVVKCGPHLNFDSCRNDLLNRVDQAVRDYRTRNALGEGYRPPNRPLPDELRNQLMTEHFLEMGDSSVGETLTLYTRVAFSREATASVRAWQAELLASNRTIFATIVGVLVVGLVGIAYGYFRIDTATLGYYTWRLRFVALFLIAGIAISGIAAGAEFFEEEWRLGGINF